MTAAVRISRVRLKSTGQEIAVLPRIDCGEIEQGLVDAAIALAKTGPLSGYFVVAWDAAGAYNRGYAVPDSSAIPRTLLPEWLAEIVRREVVTTAQIREIMQHDVVH